MDPEQLANLIEQVLGAETPEARQEALAAVTDLDAMETEWSTIAAGIVEDPASTTDDLDTAQALADAVEHLRSERTRRLSAEPEPVDRRTAIRAALAAGDATGEDPKPAKPAADGETNDDPAGEQPDADAQMAADTEPEPAAEPAVPTPKPALSAIAKHMPDDAKPPADSMPRVTVRASVDVPNFRPGQDFASMREIATAMIARQEALGRGRGTVDAEKVPVVQFNYLDSLREVGENRMLNGLIMREAALPDALTASGGFCAPSQVVYEFVKVNRPTDLAQDFLPVVGAPRGSIEYPSSPDIRDAFTENVTRAYTNQNDIDEVAKITAVVDCPSFNTCTVGAQYVILQFGNFGTRAYPEWVEHWVGLSMDAHAHKVSQKLIQQMVALSNAAVPVGPNAGATSTIISNLAMAAADFRHDLRMGAEATLEVVLPSWTVDLIRSDMARARKGEPDATLSISRQQVLGWISNLGLNPHFVEDWQDTSGLATVGASAWPVGLDVLLYPPGTFVKLDMGTLDLGVVRDSVQNATNDYSIFVESFESVCKPGIESRLYSMGICASGAFSADQNLDCSGVDIPGS